MTNDEEVGSSCKADIVEELLEVERLDELGEVELLVRTSNRGRGICRATKFEINGYVFDSSEVKRANWPSQIQRNFAQASAIYNPVGAESYEQSSLPDAQHSNGV
jgi:hypothetical protein